MRTIASLVMLASALLFAGCADNDSPTQGDDVVLPPVAVDGVNTTVFAGSVQLALATPYINFNSGGDFRTDLERTENTTGYVLELVWTPASPASERLSLWLRDTNAGAIPPSDPTDLVMPVPAHVRADGPSPLRLVVLAEELDETITYSAIVRAADDRGAAAEQAFELHITNFEGVPVDPEFTALEMA